MFILSILGILLAALSINLFIERFNLYTQKVGNYRFFTKDHTIAFVASYVIMFIGYRLMVTQWLGDSLNGAIVLTIGAIVLIMTIRNNFKSTNRTVALKGSIAQLILYVPITLVGVLILLAAFAFFAQTKPVYNINSKD